MKGTGDECACVRVRDGGEGPCRSADDWTARLFAADAAAVDSCFVVVIFISGQNRPPHSSPLLSFSLDSLYTPPSSPSPPLPFPSPAAKFPSFSSSHPWLPLATPSLHQMANTGGRGGGDAPNSICHFSSVASPPLFGFHSLPLSFCS